MVCGSVKEESSCGDLASLDVSKKRGHTLDNQSLVVLDPIYSFVVRVPLERSV